ncbi:MAG: GTPase Era [Clostridia bacterium]|nr:GTPase Era [Clostridia bacterium]
MKAGYITIIGNTNVGKSTLINKLIGQKINIVSHKQQTTRDNILGILTEKDNQFIFIDTPGIHKSKNHLDKQMNKNIREASEGADVVVYLIDGSKKIQIEEVEYVKNMSEKGIPVIVGVNKIDLADMAKFIIELTKLNNLKDCEIVPISAEKGKNLEELKKEIAKKLPEVENLPFPVDEITDKSISFLCAEIVREKVLRLTNQEIPHGVMCKVITFKESEKLAEIDIDIICERDSHKGIIIGKSGVNLKRIGESARIDAEKLLGKKVMLKLFVKVVEGWRNDPKYFINDIS